MNFMRLPGKDSHYWWLWVFITPLAPRIALYVLDPLRSSKVSLAYFKPGTRGVFLGDRYSAHRKLAKVREGLIQAFCWAHFRRDFINAGKHLTCLEPWADAWVARIANILSFERGPAGSR
jgi:transposase